MAWVRAEFKGQKVWAEALPDGTPAVRTGRVAVRYQESAGAKLYSATAANVRTLGEAPRELPDGVAPEAEGSKGGRTAGRRTSGFGSAGTRSAAQSSAARTAAADLLASFGADRVIAFTDGACQGNPGPCGAGAVVVVPDGRRFERSAALGIGTNNVGELSAVGLALDLIDEAGLEPGTPVEVLTDSKYAIGVLAQGWKAKANVDLIQKLRQRLKGRAVRLHWVAGHVGVPDNERADVLANEGVALSRQRM